VSPHLGRSCPDPDIMLPLSRVLHRVWLVQRSRYPLVDASDSGLCVYFIASIVVYEEDFSNLTDASGGVPIAWYSASMAVMRARNSEMRSRRLRIEGVSRCTLA
jgi:hypothetical protein